jgi:hypothetical protein
MMVIFYPVLRRWMRVNHGKPTKVMGQIAKLTEDDLKQ